MENEVLTVSQFQAILNQTLEFAYPQIVVQGEVANFKVNQGKWVFFDIKDDKSSLSCFMPVFQLKTSLEDGMLVNVYCRPKLTAWGKFSLTVSNVELVGEGSVKKAFEIMKAQFEKEGLFAAERKRLLPEYPRRVALITSAQAAAYNDFITVLAQRYCAMQLTHLQVQVQGESAPDQIVRALEYCNTRSSRYDVLVLIRGGGSPEDLQAFSTEPVVRAVYASKIPTMVGIGHEDDVSLAELAADVRAATPTDAARRLSPELTTIQQSIDHAVSRSHYSVLQQIAQNYKVLNQVDQSILRQLNLAKNYVEQLDHRLNVRVKQVLHDSQLALGGIIRSLQVLNPRAVLKRGYSIASIDGVVVTDSQQIVANSAVVLQLHRGSVELQRSQKEQSNNVQRQSKIEF